MINSFEQPQAILAFRKITTSWYIVANTRYESLPCRDRFVMKQITNHESDQINCLYWTPFRKH